MSIVSPTLSSYNIIARYFHAHLLCTRTYHVIYKLTEYTGVPMGQQCGAHHPLNSHACMCMYVFIGCYFLTIARGLNNC